MARRGRPPIPTEKLSPIEVSALLHEPEAASEPDRATIEMLPLVADEPDEPPEPPKLARGTEPSPPAPPELARGTERRRRMMRTNLSLEELRKKPDGE